MATRHSFLASLRHISGIRLDGGQIDCTRLLLRRHWIQQERYRLYSASKTCVNIDTVSSASSKPRTDPTAKRPTQKCDPYGQGGKPLSLVEADMFNATIHADWMYEEPHGDAHPLAIYREFRHPNYLSGARFVQKMAAIAEMNAHYPKITLDRRIVKKSWQIVSCVRCHTTVLGGLSANDFHLAMVSMIVNIGTIVIASTTKGVIMRLLLSVPSSWMWSVTDQRCRPCWREAWQSSKTNVIRASFLSTFIAIAWQAKEQFTVSVNTQNREPQNGARSKNFSHPDSNRGYSIQSAG